MVLTADLQLSEGEDRAKHCIKNEWSLYQYCHFQEGGKKEGSDHTHNNFCCVSFLIILIWKARIKILPQIGTDQFQSQVFVILWYH